MCIIITQGGVLMPEFKDMLKYFREREGLSQSELAKRLGMSASRISMYEVGKREPDFETEELIADFFNTDLNTLRGKENETNHFNSKEEEETFYKIISYYDKLNVNYKNLALEQIKVLADMSQKEQDQTKKDN